MNAHPIRHAWFPSAIPKRKYDGEFNSGSEWRSTYDSLSGPLPESRPTKRARGLTLRVQTPEESNSINSGLTCSALSVPQPTNHYHVLLDVGVREPIVEIENSSPHPDFDNNASSSPLREKDFKADPSIEECQMQDDTERWRMEGMRVENGTFMPGLRREPRHAGYKPDSGPEKRKREAENGENRSEKKEKRSWCEPEKDRIVVFDLDSSDDESDTHSLPRRCSPTSSSAAARASFMTRTRPKTEIQEKSPQFVINSALLSHLSSLDTEPTSIPRDEIPTQALVLYKPAPWAADTPRVEPEVTDIEDITKSCGQTSLPTRDNDAMDIDP